MPLSRLIRFVPCLAVAAVVAMLLAIAASSSASSAAQPLAEAEVIARVNGEVVVAGDLMWEVEMMLEERLAQVSPAERAQIPAVELDKVKRNFLQGLLLSRLDMTLFYADFRSSVPLANLPAIHANLEPRFEQNEIPRLGKQLDAPTRQELETKLRAVGTSIGERKQAYYRKMIARSWLTETVEYDKEVTHDQMLDYYRKNHDDYAVQAKARWEELMVRFDQFPTKEAAWRAICDLGNRAYQQASAAAVGKPAFEAIAKAESHGFTASEGGYHDWTTTGSLKAETVDAAIFALPVGELSTILEGPSGFHIVRVLEREEAGHEPFSEVQASIREGIKAERFDVAVQERVADLKRGARLWTVFTGDIDTTLVPKVAGKVKKAR